MNTSARFRTALEGARTWLPRTRSQGAPLGEDILLARHGDAVTRFRQDRRLGVTVAVLRGGGRDSAPNRLDAVVPSALPPAERAAAAVGDFRAGRTGEQRAEARYLAKIAVLWTVLTIAACSAMAWWAASNVDPEVLRSVMLPGGGY
ncbi:hypothetical protein [Zhihengliuella halotolerans]|uniref:hypothetical protein n=1 Tax=Zhihengliuella halotolerans TaxID=370736 RepID=UPI000C80B9CF|nr:hypothetical protein [Zhihengliuella halotolerans]